MLQKGLNPLSENIEHPSVNLQDQQRFYDGDQFLKAPFMEQYLQLQQLHVHQR